MIKRVKNIIIALFNGTPLYFKIYIWNKIRMPLIRFIENHLIFYPPKSKHHLMYFYTYISQINCHLSKFYWEELKRDNFWNEIRFFIIYMPWGFVIGILKKNIMYFRIFLILITDFLIFGFRGTLKQKKWQTVFRHFFYVLLFMQLLYFLNISLFFKLFLFSFAVYGNWKEYFETMKEEKKDPEFRENFRGWLIYGIRSLLGFFVEDQELQRRCHNLMKAGNKEFSKLWWLHNKYYSLELYFWKKEIELNIKKLKLWSN